MDGIMTTQTAAAGIRSAWAEAGGCRGRASARRAAPVDGMREHHLIAKFFRSAGNLPKLHSHPHHTRRKLGPGRPWPFWTREAEECRPRRLAQGEIRFHRGD